MVIQTANLPAVLSFVSPLLWPFDTSYLEPILGVSKYFLFISQSAVCGLYSSLTTS